MWTLFFIIALVGTVALLFYLLIELNEFEKQINGMTEDIRKHYDEN